MLLKLYKKDLGASLRALMPVNLALMAACALVGFISARGLFINISGILVLAMVVIGVTAAVMTFTHIFSHFHNDLYGREGYLMHTLPVSPLQLVASKLLSAVTVLIVCGLCGAASMLLLLLTSGSMVWSEVWGFLRSDAFKIFKLAASSYGLSVPGMCLLIALLVVSSFAAFSASAHLSVSVAHIVPRYKKLVQAACFLLLCWGLSQLLYYVGGDLTNMLTNTAKPGSSILMMLLPPSLLELAFSAVCCAVSTVILGRFLNLE